MKVVLGYPSQSEEKIILRQAVNQSYEKINPTTSPQQILQAREVVKQVYMDEKIEQYIVDIVSATRNPEKYELAKLKPLIHYGGSPRASISLAQTAKATAFIKHRGYVIPEDVRSVCENVLRHRIGLTYEAEAENITPENIIKDILNAVRVP
jgi:MoxR-like ATPase